MVCKSWRIIYNNLLQNIDIRNLSVRKIYHKLSNNEKIDLTKFRRIILYLRQKQLIKRDYKWNKLGVKRSIIIQKPHICKHVGKYICIASTLISHYHRRIINKRRRDKCIALLNNECIDVIANIIITNQYRLFCVLIKSIHSMQGFPSISIHTLLPPFSSVCALTRKGLRPMSTDPELSPTNQFCGASDCVNTDDIPHVVLFASERELSVPIRPRLHSSK